MSGFSYVSYDYDDAAARAFFEYAGYRARNPREPLHDAGEAILSSVENAFDSEGASLGRPWQELTDDYTAVKIRKWGFAYPMLQASGDLIENATRRQAIKVRVGPDGGQVEYRVTDRKASFHQQPDGPGTGKMPHRPFFEMTPELRIDIEDGFRHWLDEIKAANVRRRSSGGVNPFEAMA